jgi:hypothetical protein
VTGLESLSTNSGQSLVEGAPIPFVYSVLKAQAWAEQALAAREGPLAKHCSTHG